MTERASDTPWLVRVDLIDSGGHGSGILVSTRHVLTCWHVVAENHAAEYAASSAIVLRRMLTTKPKENVQVRVGDSQYLVRSIHPLRWVDRHGDVALDVALLELMTTPVPAVPSAKWLTDVDAAGWQRLQGAQIFAKGQNTEGAKSVSVRGRELRNPQYDDHLEVLEEFTIDMRAGHGFSGGALCAGAGNEVMCFGLLVLGGDRVGTSAAISIDAIVRGLDRMDGGRPIDLLGLPIGSVGPFERASRSLAGLAWAGGGLIAAAALTAGLGALPAREKERPPKSDLPGAERAAATVEGEETSGSPELADAPSDADAPRKGVDDLSRIKPSRAEPGNTSPAAQETDSKKFQAIELNIHDKTFHWMGAPHEYMLAPQIVGDPRSAVKVRNQARLHKTPPWQLPDPALAHLLAYHLSEHSAGQLARPATVWTSLSSNGIRPTCIRIGQGGEQIEAEFETHANLILYRTVKSTEPETSDTQSGRARSKASANHSVRESDSVLIDEIRPEVAIQEIIQTPFEKKGRVTDVDLLGARRALENGRIADALKHLENIDRKRLLGIDPQNEEDLVHLAEYCDLHSSIVVASLPSTKELQAIDNPSDHPLGLSAQPAWSSEDWLRELNEVVEELRVVRRHMPSPSADLAYRYIYTRARRLALLVRTPNPKAGLDAATAFTAAADFLSIRADVLNLPARPLGQLGFQSPTELGHIPDNWYPWPTRGEGLVRLFRSAATSECSVGLFNDNGATALYTPVNVELTRGLKLDWEWAAQTSLNPAEYATGQLFPCQIVAIFDNNTAILYSWSSGHEKGQLLRAATVAPELEDTPLDVVYSVIQGPEAQTFQINGRMPESSWMAESVDLSADSAKFFPEAPPAKKLIAVGIQTLSQRPNGPIVGLFRAIEIGKD